MSQSFTDNVYVGTNVVLTNLGLANDNFAALKSSFSGASTPSNTIAGMWWFDTTTNILKIRNEANNAWQSVWNFANNKPVITNLSNEITNAMCAAALKDPAVGTAGLRTLGTGGAQACAGNDSRLSNTRIPTDATVSQAKLKTSLGSVSTTGAQKLTLPGGQYGFYPQVKGSQNNALDTVYLGGPFTTDVPTTYTSLIYLNVSIATGYAQQRYITSSGEIHWIFVLKDKKTKKILSIYQAPDHPCFGNGGKPLLVQHPFGSYDEKQHEIVVINPSLEEIEEMELKTITDEDKPDRDLLEVMFEDYEINESSRPKWPTIPVTVGLPKYDTKKGKKILIDYRFMPIETIIKPIKKVIPKPSFIKVKKLKRIK